ncbi:MAG: ankyrin repeat domain-containing protein [Treponema sp.]|jgi:ankyrin repeat protein|nr:ankyrin repeat domain-containing protein [Treponema sp.]
MKKAFFFHALISVFVVVLLLAFAGCKSTPKETEEAVEAEEPGKLSGIWLLLQKGDSKAKDYFVGEFEVNARDPEGKTPLHYAAERGDSKLAAFFIAHGANVNAVDDSNQTPLGISVEKGDAKIAELLVSAKADIFLPIKGNTNAAKIAFSKNGSVLRSIINPFTVEAADKDGKTILHLASIEGNVLAAHDILGITSSGAIVNKKDKAQKNALDYALARPDSRDHMEIAERLILAGGNSEDPKFYYLAPAVRSNNYNIRRSDGLAPIHYAVSENYQGLINFLLEKKVDINIKTSSGSTPLHSAARIGNIQLMTMLLDLGADPNAVDAKGNAPIHVGIPANVHNEAINLLLEMKANPNLRDEHGDTPLHIVIILNRPVELVQTLLGGGSDVFIRNIQGKTPLYIAIEEKRKEVIPLLLTYGSEIFAADNTGVTPFALAVRDGEEIFDMLVTEDTVNQRDGAGNTMLHSVVKNKGIPRHIGVILDKRAIVDARNRDGDTALHIAVRMNLREDGEFLISRGANIFSANAAGDSPLYNALTSPGGIRYWIVNPNTVNAKDGLGNNMLHYAAGWKLDKAIPGIIQRGVPVESANATGETPLFMAVKANSPSTIKALLDNRANIKATDSQGYNLLHSAVRWNAVDAASFLIANGIDIDAHTLSGDTALHIAVSLGLTDIYSLLISKGANLEVRNIDGNTPFMEAVRTGLMPIIEKLASNGADPNTRNIRGDTPLHIAVTMERQDIVTQLLRMRANIHARNTLNKTPFQLALGVSPQMTSVLLTKDRVSAPDDIGNSVLHIALRERSSTEIIKAIINRGGRINAVDNNGKTPLRIAVDLGLLEQAKLLADAGADPFLTAVDNKSPAEIAFTKGEPCIRALFSGKAINAKDNSSNTILHHAARFGTPQIISTLLELGANKNIRNISYEAPADIAIRWNKTENAELLR